MGPADPGGDGGIRYSPLRKFGGHPKVQVTWKVWDVSRDGIGKPLPSSAITLSDDENEDGTKQLQVSTSQHASSSSIGETSLRDPSGKFAGLTAEEKARLVYRASLGVYDSKSDEVGFDELSRVLAPGMLVIVDANLFYWRITDTKDCFVLEANTIQCLGDPFMNDDTLSSSDEKQAGPSTPLKRKRSTEDAAAFMTPSPKKPPPPCFMKEDKMDDTK